MAKELFCPNCGPEFKLTLKGDGNGVCGKCGGTFTPGPEPKVVTVGEFDGLKGDVETLKKGQAEIHELLTKRPSDPKATPEATVDGQEQEADEEDEDL